MIIESNNKARKSTQEDILVIDTSIAPPVLANPNGPEGVFPLNSVLLRIEVKSKITRQGLSDFIDASMEVTKMQFSKQSDCKGKFAHPFSILVAFETDSKSKEWDSEYYRLCKVMRERNCLPPLSGFVSSLCVATKGFWFLKDFGEQKRSWCRLDSDIKEDRLVWLVAKASNSAYRAHAERQGRDPTQGLEIGIGSLVPEMEIFPLVNSDSSPL